MLPKRKSPVGKVPGLLEKHVVKQIRARLDQYPKEELYYFVKEAKAIRGIPDLIINYKGCFIALEVKRSKAEIHKPGAKLQEYNMKKIRDAGGFAEFIYPENIIEVFKKMEAHIKFKNSYILSTRSCDER